MLQAAGKAAPRPAERGAGRRGAGAEGEGDKDAAGEGRGDSARGVPSTAPRRPAGQPAGPASFSAAASPALGEEEGRGSPSRKQYQRRPPLASPSPAPHRLFLLPRVAASPRLPPQTSPHPPPHRARPPPSRVPRPSPPRRDP